MKFFIILFIVSLGFISCNDDGGNDIPPLVSIEALSVNEGNALNTINAHIRLSRTVEEDVTLTISTQNGSAVDGEDFIALNGEVVLIPAGETEYDLPVQIIGDFVAEPIETFILKIVTATNANIAQVGTDVVILNDDSDLDFIIPTTGYTTPTTYSGRSLIWSDEFDPNKAIADNWTYEIGNGNSGWGNNELQYYTANNTLLSSGFLVIEAREEPTDNMNYSSARMISSSLFDFQYGRVDIRAVLPKGQGIWPALWMLGSSFWQNGWPSCGEIDIMELLGHVPNEVHGSLHWDNSGAYASITDATTINTGDFSDEFHVFSIEWDANSITWFLDDTPYNTIDISSPEFNEFRAEFFFILNVAVGGNWPGSPNASTVFPQRMIVDYVRVFQ